MKIALYLGSFNPFHNGHLEVVKTALNDFKMDKVIIVPTMQNPWKEEKVLDIDKRRDIIVLNIVSLVSNKNGNWKWEYPITKIYLDLIEKELIPPYYSYATLHALKNKYCNDEVFVLVGSDTMKDIPNWMHGGQIIQDYNFLVIDRPDGSISSSKIRDIVKNHTENVDDLLKEYVSPNIINLIKQYYL